MKTYRFVTTKGSVTIPFDIRIREGCNTGTLVSVEKQKDGTYLPCRKQHIDYIMTTSEFTASEQQVYDDAHASDHKPYSTVLTF